MGKNKTESWSVQADLKTKEKANKILNAFKVKGDRTNKTAFVTMLDMVEFNLQMPERNEELQEALKKFDQSLCEVRKNAQDLVEKQAFNIKDLESKLKKKNDEYFELMIRNSELVEIEKQYMDLKDELDRYIELLKFKTEENKKLENENKNLKEKNKNLKEKNKNLEKGETYKQLYLTDGLEK